MHDYVLPTDGARLAFVLGIVASLMLYERHHLSTGSVVVPGYIGAFLLDPIVIVMTMVNALVVHLGIEWVAARNAALFGRAKYTALAVSSVAVQVVSLQLLPDGAASLHGIGLLIPGLIAHDMSRQGVRRTSTAILATGVVVGAVSVAAVLVFPLAETGRPGIDWFGTWDAAWIPFTVLVAVLTAAALHSGYGMRAGGFIGGVYLATVASDPLSALVLVVIALVTWVVVMHVLRDPLMLFGRRKFAAMMLMSSSLSWIVTSAASDGWFGDRWVTSPLVTLALGPLFVPGLLANDLERAGFRKVAGGTALLIGFVLASTRLAEAVLDGRMPVLLVVATVGLGAVVFGPQLRRFVAVRRQATSGRADSVVAENGVRSDAPAIATPIVEWRRAMAGYGRCADFRIAATRALIGSGHSPTTSSAGVLVLTKLDDVIEIIRVPDADALCFTTTGRDLQGLIETALDALAQLGFVVQEVRRLGIELADSAGTVALIELANATESGRFEVSVRFGRWASVAEFAEMPVVTAV